MKRITELGVIKFLTIVVICLFLPKCLVISNGEYQKNKTQEYNDGNEKYAIAGSEDKAIKVEAKSIKKSDQNDKTQVGKYGFLKNKWRFTFQYGLLQSRMNEYVYNSEGGLLSHLVWRNTLVSILTAGIAYKPADVFEIELKGSVTPTKGTGRWRMDDYDWMNGYNNAFTDHSFHTDGDFTYLHLDLITKFRLFELGKIDNNGIFSVYALFGVSYIELKSLQNGMSYFWYDSGNTVTEGINENGLLYRQRLITPYFGLLALYQYRRVSILAEFKYSSLNFAKSLDIHYNRDYYTYNNYHNVPVYELRVNAGYWITNYIRAFFEASFVETKTKSVYSIIETLPSRSGNYDVYRGDSGEGMNNWRYIFSLGVNVGF